MITVTLYGRLRGGEDLYLADVYADGGRVAHISAPDTMIEVSVPDNTRLLTVYVHDNNHHPGILMKLSNGFITGSHWKCTYDYHDDWRTLTYDDSAWPQAVVYNWTWGEHHLHPAQYISGERYGSDSEVYCRGWVSKYIKHDD